MKSVDEINRELRNLKRRGITIPSSKAAYRITLSDVFTPAGYISKRTSPERVKEVYTAFPELFSRQLVEDNERETIARLIRNYNTTVPSSDRIVVDVNELSPAKMNRLRISINKSMHVSNIYLPEFGLALKEAIKEARAI